MIRLLRNGSDWRRARLSRQIVTPAVIVALLFLAALGFVAFRLGQRAVVVQVEARNRELAYQVGQEISTFFQTQLDTLRLLEPQLLDDTIPERQEAALVKLRERFPYTYNDLRLLDPRGHATMVLTGTLSEVLQNGVTRMDPAESGTIDPDTAQALRTHALSITPVSFRPITGSPFVTVTLPLGNCSGAAACEPQMVLLAQIDLRSFWTKVDSMRIEGGSVSIVDQRGVILAHPDRQRVGQKLDQAAVARVFEGYEGVTSYTQGGIAYLAAYSPIGNLLGWGVIVEQEREQALAPVRTIGLVATLATLLSAICLALLLSSVVRQAVQPVAALSQSAAVIAASGDLRGDHGRYHISRDSGSNEIGLLADSFNQMIDRLGSAQADLQRWNEELEQRVTARTAQLRTVLEVARLSSGSLDEQAVLGTILEQIERLVTYDTAAIMLLDASGTGLETVATSGGAAPFQRRVQALDQFPFTRKVIEIGKPLIMQDARLHPQWYSRPEDADIMGSWLGVPLVVKERTIGVMSLFKRGSDFYREEDATLVWALASQVAIALAHARLYEESVQRVERELQVAGQIQRHLFPDRPPPLVGLLVATYYQPARETTGDFYAFVTSSETAGHDGSGSDPFGLIIGDVSGKSLPAALLMAMARTALHTAARTRPSDAAEVLQTANTVLMGEMPRGSFVASSYLWFDRAARTCALVNAAQPAPLLIRGDQVSMLEGNGSHLPLGIVAAPAYSTMTIPLQPGDLLVCYTDGVIEAFNAKRVLFGFERLEEVVRACSALSITPQQVVDRILAALVEWMGDAPQHDDIAVVAVRVTPEWCGCDREQRTENKEQII